MLKTYESLRHPGTYIFVNPEDINEKTKTLLYLAEDGQIKSMNTATLKRWYKFVEEAAPAPIPEPEAPAEPEPEAPAELTMSETIKGLEDIFDKLNAKYYEGKLPKPVITVQSTPRAYGHCTTKKVWKASEEKAQYEINIGAEFLNRPIENTCATLNHEMVHLFCLTNEIADTCQGGRYHNTKFKDEAEKRGLSISYDRTIGWSKTEPTEEFKQALKDAGVNLEIKFARELPKSSKPTGGATAGGAGIEGVSVTIRAKSWKYICPKCGQMVRSTNDHLNLICGDCMEKMEAH